MYVHKGERRTNKCIFDTSPSSCSYRLCQADEKVVNKFISNKRIQAKISNPSANYQLEVDNAWQVVVVILG